MEFRHIISGKIINRWDYLTLPYSEQEYYRPDFGDGTFPPANDRSGSAENEAPPHEHQSDGEENRE